MRDIWIRPTYCCQILLQEVFQVKKKEILYWENLGAIAAFVTLPLDVVKTRKQLYPKDYEKRYTFSILRDIYYKEGNQALLAGKELLFFLVNKFLRNETKSD